MDEQRKAKLDELQKILGISFYNLELLNLALVHPSFSYEKRSELEENNQRLEFLGDAVLELVISQWIFEEFPEHSEGELTKIRAFLVCEETLSLISKELSLGDYLILSKGEELSGGREKISILADTFEAVLGAIYLDQGLEKVRQFVISKFKGIINKLKAGNFVADYKTTLQEILQKRSQDRIMYNVVKEEGPDHDKTFYVEVKWKNRVLGRGKGKSKKEAEQRAAKEAIDQLDKNYKFW
ncbi:ribonuclease III [Thermovenabulum gondwanense]|uniref:Ribonuclease 3 n=1 Tax=Thermovenabulum gondwanense TaxID=520767 RepID=A0A162MND2_9FIRM|nr:ribonuclease III [Thermovenabulum gondwanense]KYO66781.1 Ribonuclease 3 [Thermovenabulum gondwanense]